MYRAGSFVAVVLIVLASLTIVRSQQALDAANPARRTTSSNDSGIKLLHDAMIARVAVATDRRTGRTIPAYHCRHAAGGCEERLAKFAHYLVDAGRLHGIDPWLMAAMAF